MDVKQLVKMNQTYSYYYGNYANWGISDIMADTNGNTYSFMLPLPIYESPLIESYPLPYWWNGGIKTDNVPIRDAWKNAGCYHESPFSINIPYFDYASKTYADKDLHTEEVINENDGTIDAIQIKMGDYILITYPFQNELGDGEKKVGLYLGCGVMFNPYTKKYDLIQKIAVETYGGKTWNEIRTGSKGFLPMGYMTPGNSGFEPYGESEKLTFVDRRSGTWPYNNFYNFLIDANINIQNSLSGYCYYDYANVNSIVENVTV